VARPDVVWLLIIQLKGCGWLGIAQNF